MGDRLLTTGLVTGTLSTDRLVRTYTSAFSFRSSERERLSVVEHIDDLAVLAPAGQLQADLQAAMTGLRAWSPSALGAQ